MSISDFVPSDEVLCLVSQWTVKISTFEWNLNSGFALMARYFSLLRQRKVSKRKAAPEACPLRGFPALLAGLG
ncbi:MAG TPA: hypothetical protein VET88_00705, partial [Gammaproteobacteria bacterium]|nr:hypothetical protein [Gammaproteobacteria bacterium]